MEVIRHERLDRPLDTQQELHLLPWPFLAALFAVLFFVVFFVIAN